MTITQIELKKHLHYDPDTGLFTRLIKTANRINIGDVAGSIRSTSGKSYLSISILMNRYLSHRLAWLYMTGDWPAGVIDHINGDGTDNRFDNLRDVTRQDNQRNMRMNTRNKSGITGIHFDKHSRRWRALISVDLKEIKLGFFTNIFDAACARKSAERKYGYHPNHGSERPL